MPHRSFSFAWNKVLNKREHELFCPKHVAMLQDVDTFKSVSRIKTLGWQWH